MKWKVKYRDGRWLIIDPRWPDIAHDSADNHLDAINDAARFYTCQEVWQPYGLTCLRGMQKLACDRLGLNDLN